MRARTRRIWLIGGAAILLCLAAGLVMSALRDSVVYFRAPSEIKARNLDYPGSLLRVGGLVLENSIVQKQAATQFFITDRRHKIAVITHSTLPDLFAEGQGVVAEGRFIEGGILEAHQILARHDENYMPREAYEALRRAAETSPDPASIIGIQAPQ